MGLDIEIRANRNMATSLFFELTLLHNNSYGFRLKRIAGLYRSLNCDSLIAVGGGVRAGYRKRC